MSVDPWFAQDSYGVRFEWGPSGARALAARSACLVVVDVLSFTTAVGVAVAKGTRVYPFPVRDNRAAGFAADHDAVLAVRRRDITDDHPWSLSPAALRRAPAVPRLVLPSPNGSAIAAAVPGTPVLACSLRNATAVARWIREQGWGTPDHPVTVIAAGERWPDDTLRPAIEDLLGAGALLAALTDHLSPESTLAATTFTHTPDLTTTLTTCASGRELIEGGFADDVAIAAELDSSTAVPLLTDGAFTAV
ncbi:2-phosphosulfolactate phosphatase [Nocardia puris]|uniref:2-phosphosulfolactate phosphatase n=1 Tax=Nocardia puris TaxID=208602 RepID=UPI0018939145|nr:2-phosphosulfolactate phosphatase [Nocardia puris]MBF6213416.1 2-phosphosulfolactate phosphatase [Nocardia puris]MBF6369415.1 2-phosphosulfolactate phosphatase [Nocardia puris]MBF6462296.1 2-phosphosulfolactate phosphatase [Nocardia puris]